IELSTGRLQRSFTKHTIPSLLKIPSGFFQSLFIVTKHKPDVVVSFGGYLSVPIAFAANFLKIPIIIHEGTFEIGLANKLIAPFATKVCISWKSSENYFPKKKTVLTGTPFTQSKPSEKIKKLISQFSDRPIVTIVGGSSGSHAMNVLVEK